jgi:hypothetical protein
VHVFADSSTYRELAAGAANDRDTRRIRLHDPELAPRSELSRRGRDIDESGQIAWSPWLHWIAHEMRDRTLEVVHVVAHSYLAQDQAALAVSESPVVDEDRRWSRFVGPRQLATFLDMVGAWAVGISSPRRNYSPMGARHLVDELAHRRAGPVLLHDLVSDPNAVGLTRSYSALTQASWPERSAGIALYCHPKLFLGAEMTHSVPFAESLIAEPRSAAQASGEQPAWVDITRRYLEQSTARLFPDTEGPTSRVQLAASEGVRQAVSFVNDVISSYERPTETIVPGEPADASAVDDDDRPTETLA